MSGGILAMSLIITYLAHTFFFWRSGRKSNPKKERDQKSYSAFEDENEIVHERLSHFAAQLGHMQMRSLFKNQQR
jgi:hypothetical protein